MSLEIEAGASISEIRPILLEFGAEVFDGDEMTTGNFCVSNTYFVFRGSDGVNEVMAEGANVSWSVGVRGVFHCFIGGLVEGYNEIKEFLRFLSEKIDFGFLLSFQYEDVYVVRDENGIRFLKEVVV